MNAGLAIVGMEASFGPGDGLDLFDRAIFDGLPPTGKASQERSRKVRAGSRSECKEHLVRASAGTEPPDSTSLIRSVIEGALRNARSERSDEAAKEAVLILALPRTLPASPAWQGEILREESLSRAVRAAENLLSSGAVRTVLIASFCPPETGTKAPESRPETGGAAAVALKRSDAAEEDGDRVFATIGAIATETMGRPEEEGALGEAVARAAATCLSRAGTPSSHVGYIEASHVGTEAPGSGEFEGLSRAYHPCVGGSLTCAVGNVQATTGNGSTASRLAGIIKTALCLYHRFIPALPGWIGPSGGARWDGTPFYVPQESRPWFHERESTGRVAAVNLVEGRTIMHMILSEDARQNPRRNRYLEVVAPYCFPVAAEGREEMVRQLEEMRGVVERSPDLMRAAREHLDRFRERSAEPYALMIVGHGREELAREVGFMMKGVPEAFANGKDLRTPKGSFFTAGPLGQEGKVAFVYPGVGSAYVGLGHSLFHLFPELFDRFCGLLPRMGHFLQETELYPRTQARLGEEEIWKRELRLRKDLLTIGRCGTAFFALFTAVLRHVFHVDPDFALGYSLGEPGMMASLEVWEDFGELSDRFQASPTFREELSGPMRAVKRSWNLPVAGEGVTGPRVWESFTLQAPPSEIEEAIRGEERVYLTIVNSREEAVIAGEPEACRRVIKKLGCKHYPLGLDLAIHCEPTRLEYDRIVDIYTLPVRKNPDIKFYSSSCYKPIPLRSKAVAHSIAKAYSEKVDFPRLVNQAYEDGARLFIELGSRKFCCNLIEKILAGRKHLAMAVNVKGTKDQASVVRLLAQLVSHRVPVDLSPLF